MCTLFWAHRGNVSMTVMLCSLTLFRLVLPEFVVAVDIDYQQFPFG